MTRKINGYWVGNTFHPYKDTEFEVVNTNPFDIEVLDVTDKCAWCDKNTPEEQTLKIPFKIWSEWQHTNGKFPHLEWGAVYWVEDGVVQRYLIPPQKVSAGEVEFTGEDPGGNGLVHWHHGMGGFHSHQDDNHARNLYEYSIVLSTKDNICTRRVAAPCGGFGYVKCAVEVTSMPDVEVDISMIKERVYSTVTHHTGNAFGDYTRVWHPEKDQWLPKEDPAKMYKNFSDAESMQEHVALTALCNACQKLSCCLVCQARNELDYLEGVYPELAEQKGYGKQIAFDGGDCSTCATAGDEVCEYCAQFTSYIGV